jgi:hypothetical protein
MCLACFERILNPINIKNYFFEKLKTIIMPQNNSKQIFRVMFVSVIVDPEGVDFHSAVQGDTKNSLCHKKTSKSKKMGRGKLIFIVSLYLTSYENL